MLLTETGEDFGPHPGFNLAAAAKTLGFGCDSGLYQSDHELETIGAGVFARGEGSGTGWECHGRAVGQVTEKIGQCWSTSARKAGHGEVQRVHDGGRGVGVLRVSPTSLRRWGRAGKLKARRHPVSGYKLYLKAALDRFLGELGVAEEPVARSSRANKKPKRTRK